jgi:hypothetical protein
MPVATGQDPVFDATVAEHEAYRRRYDQPDPPEPWTGLHFFLTGGTELLHPHLENNPGFIVVKQNKVGGITNTSSAIGELTFAGEFAQHVALGVYSDSGLGFRTSWWHFAEGSHVLTPFNADTTLNTVFSTPPLFGVPGFTSPSMLGRAFGVVADAMYFSSELELHVWDWEVTRKVHLGDWDLLFSGGMRYTYLSQSFTAFRFNMGNGRTGTSRIVLSTDSNQVGSGHNLSAIGPTAAIEVRRPLGNSGFTIYGIGRSSVVFGRGHTHSFQATTETGQVIPPKGSTQSFNFSLVSDQAHGHNDTLPIEEVEIGVEWSCLWGRTRWFVQSGVISQAWFNAGSGSSEQGDMTLFGLSLNAGFTF